MISCYHPTLLSPATTSVSLNICNESTWHRLPFPTSQQEVYPHTPQTHDHHQIHNLILRVCFLEVPLGRGTCYQLLYWTSQNIWLCRKFEHHFTNYFVYRNMGRIKWIHWGPVQNPRDPESWDQILTISLMSREGAVIRIQRESCIQHIVWWILWMKPG